jgi:flavin-dependent dehydrogenase/chorismate-pyruvate lyase
MTSTLERFHGARIHLQLLRTQCAGDFYFREVVLVLQGTEKPVEFGAIKINLSLFDRKARDQILQGYIPLGRILNESGMTYTSRPKAFLKIQSDNFINHVLKLSGSYELFGRRNTLTNERNEVLAEIVEILSPAPVGWADALASRGAPGWPVALPSPDPRNHFDAIIIGGGPAGASAASILAGHGHRVLVLEREKFPRYHIGESLLPFCFHPLQRLGLIDKLRASAFVKKYSVQFVASSGKASQPFYFNTRYPDDIAQTWQVLRSEFDEMLLNHARDQGAIVREETPVKELMRDPSASGMHPERNESSPGQPVHSHHPASAAGRVIGVRAQDKAGKVLEFFAPITIDCSGREAFTAVRQNWRMGDPYLHKVAVWTYYRGAKRDQGIDAGATTVAFVPEKGWFWYIPLHHDLVSVGVVAEGKYLTRDGVKAPEKIFQRELEQNPWIKQHLSCGTQSGEYFVTGEFSYHTRYCAAPGLLLAGDAYCFLDPVFSSGLMLALKSGVAAGDAVHEALLSGDFAPEQFADYGRTLRQGIENMRKLVYAFYQPNFSFRKLTDRYPELAGDVTDCLSGDINKDFSRLWNAIREFAEVPEELSCGAPFSEPALAPLTK